MEKPILATNIDGLLIESTAFTEPHRQWFERAIKKTKDTSLSKWIGRENYFLGVNEAMEKIMPDSPKNEQTKKAREWYQKDVIKYIEKNPQIIKENEVKKLLSLKEKYILILLTTNTKDYIDKILRAAKLEHVYDFIIASETDEEPDKEKLVNELITTYGKPEFYLSDKNDEKLKKALEELDIKVITSQEMDNLYYDTIE